MISVTILTKNNEKMIHKVLESVRDFDEVVIYDTGSTDKTLEIAASLPNVTIHHGKLKGFGPTHNEASACAKHDWILSLDSDEVMPNDLRKEILDLNLDHQAVYSFPRHNYYNGKWIRWCGWYPDRVIRLYNRKKTRFSDAQVHERILQKDLQHIPLNGAVKHYSYLNTSDFLDKMQSYSDLFAEQNHGKKKSSPVKALMHALGAFLKCYVLKRGFLGGYEGFLISSYNANTAFYKYIKLYEKNCS